MPYFICLVTGGIPIFFLEVGLGQFTSEGGITAWNICPVFRGNKMCKDRAESDQLMLGLSEPMRVQVTYHGLDNKECPGKYLKRRRKTMYFVALSENFNVI